MNASSSEPSFRDFFASALQGYAVVAFFIGVVLQTQWSNEGPRAAQGLYKIAHSEHGAVSYFTAFQSTALFLLFAPAMVAMAVSILLLRKWRRQSRGDGYGYGLDGRLIVASMLSMAVCSIAVFWVGPYFVVALNASGVVLSLDEIIAWP